MVLFLSKIQLFWTFGQNTGHYKYMPYKDGTGPLGAGPRTGRSLGPCGSGLRRGRVGRGSRRTVKDEKKVLEEEAKCLKEELAAVEKELDALKDEK